MPVPKPQWFLAVAGGALLGTLALVLLYLGGFPIVDAAQALWGGSLGSWYSITSATLVRSIPLMLAGGGVAIAFRGGVFNIGAEGQFLVGAAVATVVALAIPHGGGATIALALLAGGLAGAAWAGIAAQLRASFGVPEVISTIMLNFVALHGVSFLVRGPLQETTHSYPQSGAIAETLHLARLPTAGRLHAGLIVALVALGTCGWVFRRSASGFRLLAVGESASAAGSAGMIDVRRVTRGAFLWSGAFAGVAGAVEVLGVTFALYENLSPGYGFTAIAVALLAGLDPWRVVLSAILFGALEAGGGAMQRDAGIPATFVSVMEALLILGVTGAQALRWRGGWARTGRRPEGGTEAA